MLFIHRVAFAKAYLKKYLEKKDVLTIELLTDGELVQFVDEMLVWEKKSFPAFYK